MTQKRKAAKGCAVFDEPNWKRYIIAKKRKKYETQVLRNEIIEYHLVLLINIAEQMSRKFPPSVTLEDCRQSGYLGLHSAVEAFEPERNVNFVNYASIRIRGSILDYVRSIDPLSRQLRSMQSRFIKAKAELEKRFGRKPTDEELINEMKVTTEEFSEFSRRTANFTTVSLYDDYNSEDDDKSLNRLDMIIDYKIDNPQEKLEENEIFNRILKRFTLKERLVMILYYKELLSLKEIGSILDLSESRVSQIRTHVIRKLGRIFENFKEKLVH